MERFFSEEDLPSDARYLLGLYQQRASPSPGNPELVERIKERIRRCGPITFAEFMRHALYEPGLGYYSAPRLRIGHQGDYLTAPEVHPLFGALLARFLLKAWEALGQPSPFHLIEMGAEGGSLARQILEAWEQKAPEGFPSVCYVIVEPVEENRRTQQQRLASWISQVQWFSSLEEVAKESWVGVFLSNELVDAFPFHQVRVEGGELREVYVALEQDRFIEVTGPLSTPEIDSYLQCYGIPLKEGQSAEVHLEAVRWIRQVAQRIRQGYVLTIDYGDKAENLYVDCRKTGTLWCYYQQRLSEDPYVRIGEQDITAWVNFTALIRAGEESGLRFLWIRSQQEFLLSLGLRFYLRPGRITSTERRALLSLIDPLDLGRLQVLLQAKGAPGIF